MNYFSYRLLPFLLLVFFFITAGQAFAQTPEPGIATYDVVYMKNGRILKGEILVFEVKDGDITFRDMQGRNYSITREEYDYFVEDMRYSVKNKDTLIIRPRKTTEMEISLGFSAPYVAVNHDFKADSYYLYENAGLIYLPLSLKFGLGKYINRQNFAGVTADIGLTSGSSYFSAGLRYSYQYDAYKKNTSFYIPVELSFSNLNATFQNGIADTVFSNGGYSYPAYVDSEVSLKSIGIHVGQGVAFILNNKKSISLELLLFRNFVVSHKYIDIDRNPPSGNFSAYGLKLAFFYNI